MKALVKLSIAISVSLSSLLVSYHSAKAQNLAQISKAQGLTSSFVLSVCQDTEGLVWIGTTNGVKVLYNEEIHSVETGTMSPLRNVPIEHLVETRGGGMWIQTASGLYRLNPLTNELFTYRQFEGKYLIRGITGMDDIVVLDKNEKLFIYRSETDSFEDLHLPVQAGGGIINISFGNNYLWTAGRNGLSRYPWIGTDERKEALGGGELVDGTPVAFCNISRGGLYIVDDKGMLSVLDITTSRKRQIMDLSDEIRERGQVTSIIYNGIDLFVGCDQKGALRYIPEGDGWRKEDFGINVGVLAMKRDRLQDIIWIATNGQGLYKYWNGEYIVRNFSTVDYDPEATNPVSTVLTDGDFLWVGTMGSGLVRLRKDPLGSSPYTLDKSYRAQKSALVGNHVYSMTHGVRIPGIWIGTNEGLNFYDKATSTLLKVKSPVPIKAVSSIIETTASGRIVLGTSGYGVYGASFRKEGGEIILDDVKSFSLEGGEFSSNIFTGSILDSSGKSIWIGNSRLGVFNMDESGMKLVEASDKNGAAAPSNVLSLYNLDDKLWVGTGRGVVMGTTTGEDVVRVTSSDGMPNETVHSILPHSKGGIWAATNNGIVHIDPTASLKKYLGYQEGLRITEFCDGAATQRDSTMIFGGVDGWVEITPSGASLGTTYVPPFFMADMTVADSTRFVYVWANKEGNTLRLPRQSNSVEATFMALDNLNNYALRYKYSITRKGQKEEWKDNGSSPKVYFSRLSPGDYTIRAKCYYIFSDLESESSTFHLSVPPMWYQTRLFKALMLLGLLLLVYLGIAFLRMKEKGKRESALKEMQARHEEDLYKEKLQSCSSSRT